MGLFHVYVEAPDRSPDAIAKLALTIGKKYGVPVAELEKRLTAGRFRVKANVDRQTADAYAKALAESGAIVKIEDAVPTQPVPVAIAQEPASGRAPAQLIKPVERSSPSIAPPSGRSIRPSGEYSVTARPSSTSMPPANAGRSGLSVLTPAEGMPRTTTGSQKSQPIASGLSAAFTESAEADLGALSTDSIKLSSLDGKETGSQKALTDELAPPVDLAPPPAAVAAGATSAKKQKPNNDPVDLFAPPESAEDAAFLVELAPDEVAHRAQRMSTPPAAVAVAAPVAPSTPQLGPVKKRQTPVAGAPVTVAPDAQDTPRWRFAAGVLIAILLGFLPAHLIASSREASTFAEIDKTVVDTQNGADTDESYQALDAFREAQLAKKQSAKRSIAMQSMAIWAVLAGGLAYVWFRRVPWDRVTPR